MNLKENDYAMWLSTVPGLGSGTAIKLVESGASCRQLYEMEKRELPNLLSEKQKSEIIKHRRVWDFEKEDEKLRQKGIRFISFTHPQYPEKLKVIADAPFGIYVKGRLPDPDVPSVAIIGARMCSDYGRYMARQFGRDLALSGVQVISGMARGVDGISQKAAVEAGGKSFGIVGSGVDICYPEDNMPLYEALCENGGIISEYPPGTMPRANFFPMRNRIISGLADVVVVVEARLKSGTQITVDTALEQGREVVALPGRVTDRLSDGCNQLICQGAGIVLGTDDVLEKLFEVRNRMLNKRNNVKNAENAENAYEEAKEEFFDDEVSTIEDRILENLDIIPTTASSILEGLNKQGTDITIPELMRTLMDMTGNGRIIQEGAYYRKILDGTACAKRYR